MRSRISGLRNKLMAGMALLVAAALATPAAFARDHNGHDDSDVLGALVVGAVIGGLLVSATDHDRDYGYYYPARSYAPVGYYGGAYRSAPYYGPGYYGGGYYPRYGHSHGVHVDIRSSRGYYGGRSYYGSHDYRGYDHRYHGAGHGNGSHYRTGNTHDHRDSRGSYYNH